MVATTREIVSADMTQTQNYNMCETRIYYPKLNRTIVSLSLTVENNIIIRLYLFNYYTQKNHINDQQFFFNLPIIKNYFILALLSSKDL